MNDAVDEIPFEVSAEWLGSSVRLRVSGELDLHRESELRSALEATLDEGALDELVLDVRGLQFLDSSGLRSLLVCRDRTQALGARFRLAVSPGPVTRLLVVAGVQSWFDYE
jgi:anti-sigma B factor antagonist